MKEVLEREIKVSKEAIKSMLETIKKCESGLDIQYMVLEKFEEELKKCTSTS